MERGTFKSLWTVSKTTNQKHLTQNSLIPKTHIFLRTTWVSLQASCCVWGPVLGVLKTVIWTVGPDATAKNGKRKRRKNSVSKLLFLTPEQCFSAELLSFSLQDIWQCFQLSQPGRRCYWHLLNRGQCWELSYNAQHRMVPTLEKLAVIIQWEALS